LKTKTGFNFLGELRPEGSPMPVPLPEPNVYALAIVAIVLAAGLVKLRWRLRTRERVAELLQYRDHVEYRDGWFRLKIDNGPDQGKGN
jgi:hypothetical protein